MKISLTNSKLGGQIPSVNLPPILTCRKNAPCSSLCYARKGNFCYANVKKSHLDNLEHYQKNPKNYFDSIIAFLNGLTVYKLFRWHSAGDIVDMQYLEGIIRVANECPQTKFLCFTKKWELVNRYCKENSINIDENYGPLLPSNLKIVFSMWDKEYNNTVENPYNFPTTWVYFKDKIKNGDIPETAFPCTGKCYECFACWNLGEGCSTVFKQH